MTERETAAKYLKLIKDGILITYSMTDYEKKQFEVAIEALGGRND